MAGPAEPRSIPSTTEIWVEVQACHPRLGGRWKREPVFLFHF